MISLSQLIVVFLLFALLFFDFQPYLSKISTFFKNLYKFLLDSTLGNTVYNKKPLTSSGFFLGNSLPLWLFLVYKQEKRDLNP